MTKDEELHVALLGAEIMRLRMIVFPEKWTPAMQSVWDSARTDDIGFRGLRELMGIK